MLFYGWLAEAQLLFGTVLAFCIHGLGLDEAAGDRSPRNTDSVPHARSNAVDTRNVPEKKPGLQRYEPLAPRNRKEAAGIRWPKMVAVLFLVVSNAVPAIRKEGTFRFGPVCGAVTTRTATVVAGLTSPTMPVTLWASRYPDLRDPVVSAPDTARAERGLTVRLTVSGLTPATRYFYGLAVDGRLHPERGGRFTTFPESWTDFSFAFGNSLRFSHPRFSALNGARKEEAYFFLNTGDLFYADITRNRPELFRHEYRRAFAARPQAALCRTLPLVFMWDDHDYADNNSNRLVPSREASRQVYQEMVPHYPLAAGNGDVPIYQAFSLGRARFILTDLRSERSPNSMPDGPGKTMMGLEQREWFIRELVRSSASHMVVFWVSSVPYTAPQRRGADHWGGFTHERRIVANTIKHHHIDNLYILSGDAHCVAADDGSNGDYADGGGAPVPMVIAAPLDNTALSIKGGPYSHGYYYPVFGENCYGLITVRAKAATLTVVFSARNQNQRERLRFVHTIDLDYGVEGFRAAPSVADTPRDLSDP